MTNLTYEEISKYAFYVVIVMFPAVVFSSGIVMWFFVTCQIIALFVQINCGRKHTQYIRNELGKGVWDKQDG